LALADLLYIADVAEVGGLEHGTCSRADYWVEILLISDLTRGFLLFIFWMTADVFGADLDDAIR
jgi:hypothetical protein